MISPVTKEIEGFKVRFMPLPATKAFTLAKRVGSILLPVLKSIDLSDLKAEVDLDRLLGGITEALASLPDDAAVGILVDSLKGCTIVAPGQAAVEVQGSQDIDAIFQGELEALYSIVLESWKFNKLAPFRLAARFGFQTTTTDTSSEAADIGNRPGPALAM